MKRVLIVGGGAAGMMAALFAARNGAAVTLLERNEKLGKKVYITGKGRCNLTNAAEKEVFFQNVLRNPRFLYASFALLDNFSLIALMEELGMPVKIERGQRAFPVSDKASDVTRTLEAGKLVRLGVTVRLNARVASLRVEEGRVVGAELESGAFVPAEAVVLATGGKSYPSTGSTGDGYRLAHECGHSAANPLPALVPIETVETWPMELTGLSLKNVRLTARQIGNKKPKTLFSEMGEMLFTHFGVSGPLVLTLSSLLPEDLSSVQMEIDLKPALDEQTLDHRLVNDFRALSRKQLITAMDGLAPHSLALQLCRLAEISPAKPIHSVTQEERKRLVREMKALPLRPARLRGFEEAIVDKGAASRCAKSIPPQWNPKFFPGSSLPERCWIWTARPEASTCKSPSLPAPWREKAPRSRF